jgi:hypothetical protein
MSTQEIMSEAYRGDMRWAREHFAELHDRYENQWIAVVDQQVVAAGSNLGRVEDVAARKTGRKTEEIYVEFIESRSAIYEQGLPPL